MALGDLFKTEFRYNVTEQPVTVTLGFEHTASDGANEFELCSLISAQVAAEMSSLRDHLSSQCSFEGAITRKLSGAPQPPGVSALIDVRGTESTASIPHSKALMVVHKQETGGVRRNGKSYISGLPESKVSGNSCTDNAAIVAIRDIFDDLLTFQAGLTGTTADFRMVVLSRPGGAPNPWIGLPVTANRLGVLLYNQRRRQTREFGFSGDDDQQ